MKNENVTCRRLLPMALAIFATLSCHPGKSYLFDRGTGTVEFRTGKIFENRIVPIHYYIPATGDLSKMPLQIVLHGAGRNAEGYLEGWKEKAEKYGVAVIAPEFKKETFPLNDYQLSRITDEKGRFYDPDSTTFSLIDRIFKFVTDNSPLKCRKYNIFGHSAGAQFVHRFLLFYSSPFVDKAVAANAGWYTFPDETIGFPYGLGGCPLQPGIDKENYFRKNLILLLGTADTVITSDLRITREANAQGSNRFERGNGFYEYALKTADSLGISLAWKKSYVEGVAHQGKKMSAAAADYLYGSRPENSLRP